LGFHCPKKEEVTGEVGTAGSRASFLP